MTLPKNFRNIAIIAHIDHGKTTLLDALLQQSRLFRENALLDERMMDSYDQEKERGITIFSKHTAIPYEDYTINIIDTPGHADFSGEVQRVLGMVDSVLLLVDAQEGPMPQTRFVLSQALKKGLRPIVVVNKMDKPHAQPDRALDLTFDLFVELGASDEQLDFPYCYASGLNSFACREIDDPQKDMTPLFAMIIEEVPAPKGEPDGPFLMQVATIHFNDYVGRQATGRIVQGSVTKGQAIACVDREGRATTYTIARVEGYRGLEKVEKEIGYTGDIVSLSGIPDVMLGDTLCDPEHIQQLPSIAIDEPTVAIDIFVNTSPFAGKEGKYVTFSKLKERLAKEKRANISLSITESTGQQEAITVAGKGELHLAVLIEALRREGYELSLSKPRVVTQTIDGVLHEPLERAYIEVPEEFQGAIIEELSRRKGEMQSLQVNAFGITSLEFLVPTRGIMGFRCDFLTMTRGLGIMSTLFTAFVPWKGEIPGRKNGVLIAMSAGKASGYAAFQLQDRGTLFTDPGDDLYEGMVVGENCRANDLIVNLTKGKQLTNIRASGSDEAIQLTPPRRFTLEQAIDYIADDELVEVTPKSIRLRKRLLTEVERKRASRK